MTPEQIPMPENTPPGHPNRKEKSATYRIPLSVNETSVGFAIFHLDQNNMPARIELMQNTAPSPSKAFEIKIEEPELRRLFDPEKLAFDVNGNTVASIRDMLSSANDYARIRGLVYPMEARGEDSRSLFTIGVPGSDHSVSYITSHIPVSLDEWTFGHTRHHISAIRKDSSGSFVASLTTESLEYPDGSMRLNVTISNYLFDQKSPALYHFSSCARGSSARAALTIELESLHTDITTLPIFEFLTPYFSQSANPELALKSRPAPGESELRDQLTMYIRVPDNAGVATLSQGAKISWNFAHNQGNLTIYPHANGPEYQISYTQVNPFGPPSAFFRLISDITSESRQRMHQAVSALSGKDYSRLRMSLKESLPTDILNNDIIEKFGIRNVQKLSPESLSGISHADETFAVLEGKEWIGFKREPHQQFLYDIPHQIYLRVWQGACDKIVLTSHSKFNDTMTIRARTGDLFSGSIPEMREAIGEILKLFSINPYRILQYFNDANPHISPLYGLDPNPALRARLSFFSELLLEDSSRPNRLFSSSNASEDISLLAFIAQRSELALLTSNEREFVIQLDFSQDQLQKISVLRKKSFWERLITFGGERSVLLKQKLPLGETPTAQSVVSLCHRLHGLLENYSRSPDNSSSTRNLTLALQSSLLEYLSTAQRTPENTTASLTPDRVHA